MPRQPFYALKLKINNAVNSALFPNLVSLKTEIKTTPLIFKVKKVQNKKKILNSDFKTHTFTIGV